MFAIDKRQQHEEHHKKVSWVYYSTLALGFWLLTGPSGFGYVVPKMIWSDILAGVLLIVFSYFALKPYKLWAQWAVVFIGTWLFVAPMIFWAQEGAALLNNYLIGTLVVAFGIIIPGQPGIRLFAQPGPNVPPGWNYNPSSWNERIPVIFLSWVGFFVAKYMGAYQLGYIDNVWDPFFGNGTIEVLDSEVSKSFPVSDAMLGAFSYLFDILFAYAGGTHRWRTMPWVVIIFGILIIPLGVVSITLVILQPLSVGHWCTLCLTSAMVSLIMIPFAIDEVLATLQLLKYEKRVRKKSYWTTLWFGGTMEGGNVEETEHPKNLLKITYDEMVNDIATRPLNLVAILLVGIWIMGAPGVLNFSGAIANTNYVTGALIFTFAVISMSEVARPLRFINILLAIWLIASPWIYDHDGALWNNMIAGVIVILLSFRKGKVQDQRGDFDRYIF